jgi:ABC-type nitrate/sulfonate/bicarbonate transport system substrate-binding protein
MKKWTHAMIGGLALAMASAGPVAAQNAPETKKLTIGLPVTAATFLPIYLAVEDGLFEKEGVKVEVVAFRGGSDLVRGMIAGAVEIGVTSFAGVSVGIAAKQPLKVFYGGFNMAIFEWWAVPGIKTVQGAKGKRWGVTRVGSSTDFLTRYALKSNGMDPRTDVRIIQGGGSSARLAAMESGQIDVNIFIAPHKFIAADRGYNKILSQSDLAEDYPFHVFFAMETFIKKNPNTIRAILRGFVRGVRLAKTNKKRSLKTIKKRIGMKDKYAGRTYDDFIDKIYEDGRLPSDKGMNAFWNMGIQAGVYKKAWPRERYWLSTFRDSYSQWKPK